MAAPFPVEAPRDLQLRVFHRLGESQYVLTLLLRAGEGVQECVLEAFQQGQLPGCLYRPMLEYAMLAVRESLGDPDPLLQTATLSVQSSLSPATIPASGQSLDAILLDIEERQWPKLLTCSGISLPVPSRQMTFWCAYDFLLRHCPVFFRTIGMLEESYLKENRDLQVGRITSISQLQTRQSIEMENIRQQAEQVHVIHEGQNVSHDVQNMVAQHVGELDAVELHWRTEIQMLEAKQRASYCDLVVDFFEQEIQQVQQEDADVASSAGAGMGVASAKTSGEGGGEAGAERGDFSHISSSAAGAVGTGAAAFRPLLGARRLPGPGLGGELSHVSSLDIEIDFACPLRHVRPAPPAPNPPHLCKASVGSMADVAMERSGGGVCGIVEEARGGPPASSLQECAEVRAVFGHQRVFFVLRVWVGDIMDLLQEEVSTKKVLSWATDDFDGAGPQLPPEFVGPESYGHRYFARGSGLPVEGAGWPLICFERVAGPTGGLASSGSAASVPALKGRPALRSPSLRFWPTPRLPKPVPLSPNAYAEHLRGLIIPTPENLKFETAQAVMLREFASRCGRVTDLHFPPLPDQLSLVKTATGNPPLKIGDYFCTRHSNLGGAIQAAFHLLTNSSEAPASDEVPAPVRRALQRVVGDCHDCHVAELSLPLLLLDIGTSESSLPYTIAQRRAENALRAVKGALTWLAEDLAPSELPGLEVLNLVLPPSCAQSIGAGVPSVVEATLTFLEHSFQCV